ncbi:MAG: E3 binding domain-containing protein, partial [Pseudolabrys sp.]|nr:E3 binding domain-containing protein [Pseudolabrys sp.]
MPTNILMPALSPTMEKGNLARWLKKEGDRIRSGEVIAEIETDKATMEYEAAEDGVLAKILVPEGTQDVAVNSVIAVLAGEGEDVGAAAGAAAARQAPAAPSSRPAQDARQAAPAAATATPSSVARPAASQAPAAADRAPAARIGNRIFASPLARRLAREAGIDLARLSGSGPHGRIIARDVEAAKSRPSPA